MSNDLLTQLKPTCSSSDWVGSGVT